MPDNYVLLAVDMQEAFNTSTAVDNLKDLLDSTGDFFTGKRLFTIFVNEEDSSFRKILNYDKCSTPDECQIVSTLIPYVDKQFTKSTYSALTPELLSYLRSNNVDTVYITGFDTDGCVLATAFSLFDNGFRPILIQNCCASTASDYTLNKDALDIARRSFGMLYTSGDVKEIANGKRRTLYVK